MNSKFQSLLYFLLLIALSTSLMGTRACRDTYSFARQSNASGSPTATPSGSVSSSVTATPTATETPTATDTATETPTATVTATPDETPDEEDDPEAENDDDKIFRLSKSLNINLDNNSKKTKPENWLGRSYADSEIANRAIDTDNDGFADVLELDFGADPNDPQSTPPRPVTNLAERLIGIDNDADGLRNDEEIALGTVPNNKDSDNDGISDGAEILSNSNPLDPTSKPYDPDGDGLSSDYEASLGINMREADTDRDRLRDDLELAIGSNPLVNDTDKDGILDGKEVELGSDPTVPEK